MKKIKQFSMLILIVSLILTMTSCMGSSGRYRVIDKIEEQKFCLQFREGDMTANSVIGALAVLQENGVVSSASLQWFGEDLSIYKGDVELLATATPRQAGSDYLIGYDVGRLPFSGVDESGNPIGYNIDLAKEVAGVLGWSIKFVPIDSNNSLVELKSGNVDCVWGVAQETAPKDIYQSEPYIKNNIVVVSLGSSNIRSISGLKEKTLILSTNDDFDQALVNNKTLNKTPDYIVEVNGGTAECFKALLENRSEAIITDELALDYYR